MDSEELFIALARRCRFQVLRADLLVRAAQPLYSLTSEPH